MNYLFYFTFLFLIFLVSYYFIHKNKLNNDNLFTIILNFIFLIILPLYFSYFKDIFLSLIISVLLFISALFLNLKIKDEFHETKIAPLIYFLITCYILGFMIGFYLK